MTFGLGYVHPGKVHHAFMESVMRTLIEMGDEVIVIPRLATANLARFRNEVIERAISVAQPALDGLLFVDTDIVFTVDDVRAIIKSEYDITSGLYYGPIEDKTFPVFNIGTKALRRGDHADVKGAGGKPFQVAAVGMGFCYIKRDVLMTLGVGPLWPFGEYVSPGSVMLGEDVGFSVRATNHGFTCWVDPRIEVRHIKEHML